MKPITVYSNWCYFDRLGDKDLEHGEIITVLWPDGTEVANIKVELEKTSEVVGDMGHDVDIPIHKAYFWHCVNGSAVKMFLRGSGLLARRGW